MAQALILDAEALNALLNGHSIVVLDLTAGTARRAGAILAKDPSANVR